MFFGSIPALITPFKNGAIDWPAFDSFVEWQIEQGSHALVPVGTTGESPTLTHDEHKAVVRRCIEIAARRVPVIAGCGSNSTAEAIALTLEAKQCGADAALIVTPYYNKPSQDGMAAHFTAIHDAAGLPIIIYNIPGRSVVDMSVETMARLAQLPNIIGVKDATGDLDRPLRTRRAIGPDFCQLSGNDGTVSAFLAQGGVGCISVTANVAPALCAQLHNAWRAGQWGVVEEIRDRLGALHDALFVESSPAPIKYACSRLGLCREEVRLPLLSASARCKESVDAALHAAGIAPAPAHEKQKAHG